MGITHNYQTVDNQGLCFMSPSASGATANAATGLCMAKSYGVITPEHYAADTAHTDVNMRRCNSPAVSQRQHCAKWSERPSDRHNRRFYSEKKYVEPGGNSIGPKLVSELPIAAMNVSSMISSPAATDLSQHSTSSNAGNLHLRDSSYAKTFPHIVLPSHTQHQAAARSRETFTTQVAATEKDDKRYNVGEIKHSLWGSFEAVPPLIADHQHIQGRPHQHHHPYETTFCSECNPAGISPHASVGGYEMSPLLLKDSDALVKQERDLRHPASIQMRWGEKSSAVFDKMLGTVYKQSVEKEPYYLKPPPVDLDDLSDDERERMRVKRERNRVAAAKCRNRRRELLERLEKEAEQLEREQEVLRDNVKRLQAQKKKLGTMLDSHEPGCSNNVDENSANSGSVDVESPVKTTSSQSL